MNRKIRDIYLLLMYFLAIGGSVHAIIISGDRMWISLLLAIFWFFSFTVRNLLLYNTDLGHRYVTITYFAEIVILIGIRALGGVAYINLLLCITLADCFIACGLSYGAVLLVIILLSNIASHIFFNSADAKEILQLLIKETPILVLTALVSYLVGRVLKSSALLEASIRAVEEREVKLRAAYHELSQAYKNLEEMATLRERNRIAREIHDTVGHTLTTVIVEMEAGKMLGSIDDKASREKYEMAQTQAVKALNEMRASVRMLAEENYNRDLKQKINDILEDTSKHTGVIIKSILDIPEGTKTPFDELIIRALSELITNGIRHGKSTAFFLKLQLKKDTIYILFQDNGTGCEGITFGFGLKNMKKGIEGAGGSITFRTEKDEGFETEIELPLMEV